MKKVLIITHHDFADPGIITNILQKDFLLSTINYKKLNKLKINETKSYSLFIFIGGNMSANSKSRHILNEYKFISKLIELNKNILGICLGAQIIAKIYGSKISFSKNQIIEVGYRKTNLKKEMHFLQFHNEGISLNPYMEVLAQGRLFDIDAFKIKNKNIYGFQFHPEVNNFMIESWYKDIDKKKKGVDSLKNILRDYKKYNKANYLWINNHLKKILYD